MRVDKERNNDEDADLVRRTCKGDLDAFEKIIYKYEKMVFNISYRMIGDYNDAAEVAQDTFLSAYRNIKTFKGKSRFSTWLYSIVMNLSRNMLKKTVARTFREPVSLNNPVVEGDCERKIEFPSGESSVLERLEQSELDRKVQECIKGLDSDHREVVVLRDIRGFSYDEIADMLELASGTVKSRLYRARMSLKECLKSLFGEL